jgi:hypothetical protein
MASTTCSVATNNVASLDDLPNDVGGLTPAQLKAVFDKFGADFVAWFNATHIGTDKIHIGDNPAARVYHDAAQSIANNTLVALAFNSERYDNDTMHDNATNNSRLTAKTAGKYHIVGNVEFEANASNTRALIIRLNGATNISFLQVPPAAVATNLVISTTYSLSVGDYVELIAYQNSGGALNVNSSANYSPEFMMERVG